MFIFIMKQGLAQMKCWLRELSGQIGLLRQGSWGWYDSWFGVELRVNNYKEVE